MELPEEDHTHTSIATVSFTPEPEMEIYGEVWCLGVHPRLSYITRLKNSQSFGLNQPLFLDFKLFFSCFRN